MLISWFISWFATKRDRKQPNHYTQTQNNPKDVGWRTYYSSLCLDNCYFKIKHTLHTDWTKKITSTLPVLNTSNNKVNLKVIQTKHQKPWFTPHPSLLNLIYIWISTEFRMFSIQHKICLINFCSWNTFF